MTSMKTQAMLTEKETIRKTRTPATDYREFLRALRRGGWTFDELTLDRDWPGNLGVFVATVGEENYANMIEKAISKGDLTEDGIRNEKQMVRKPEANGEHLKAGNGSEIVVPTPPPATAPQRTPEQIQEIVNQMVCDNGNNVLHRADCLDILARYDLKRSEVTDRMVERADENARRKLKDEFTKRNERSSNRLKVVWEGDEKLDPEQNPDHPVRGSAAARRDKEEREKTETRERLEKLRSRKNGEKTVNNDGESHIMEGGEDINTFTISEGEDTMKLSKAAARELLTAAGFEAERWSAKKLTSVLNNRDELADTIAPKQADLKEKLEQVFQTVCEGKKVTVIDAAKTSVSSATKKPERKKREKKDGEMSCADAAVKVLSETKKESMSAAEITERMIEKGYWSTSGKTPVATVGARIYVEIQNLGKESRFKQVSRGQFALRK